ncbi:MAG: hypothetical protein A2V65_12465 [Deltaproteobacteria bacterium RBG_13_49_15]|nr:MAG: hypothetical protein A2V65_12465 [Deltaproteobacteria bacterium RBG_13_49_15]
MNPWSKEEVAAAVEDYFSMLQKELHGEPYSKTAYRKKLLIKLNLRNAGAVELKHQTISAVLLTLGLPYIKGYKPLENYQTLLLESIDTFLQGHPHILSGLIAHARKRISSHIQRDLFFRNIEVDPPKRLRAFPAKKRHLINRLLRKYDFVSLEGANLFLAGAGEQFVIDFEKARLRHEGQSQLADKVGRHPEKEDESGCDIHSFETDGKRRYINVKTTNCDFRFPFMISLSELAFSDANPDHFYLYRVFDFSQAPRLFILKGRLKDHVRLFPASFQARFG